MIRVTLPGSTSNIGPGFDTLGLAVNRYMRLTVRPHPHLEITANGYGSATIPTDDRNLIVRTIQDLFRSFGKIPGGLSIAIDNGIPDCGGLGVSGAMIAGGVILANELGALKLPMEQMLTIAAVAEGHPDNVTAALLGGLTVSSFDGKVLHTRSIPVTGNLSLVVALPDFRIVTKEARSVLPDKLPFAHAVRNVQNAASLVAALSAGDFTALRWATEDRLHEHIRARQIKGFDDVKQSALSAGAIAVTISGSGPSMVAFTNGPTDAIGRAMVDAFARNGVTSDVAVMKVENSGVNLERE